MYHMSVKQMQEMYLFNNERRERLLAEALHQPSKKTQLSFIVDYFLNNLPIDQIAKIDNVSPREVASFDYDFSYLEDYGADSVREKWHRNYGRSGYGVTLPPADVDIRTPEKAKIYPSFYALKLGTCAMFSAEIQRICHELEIPSKSVTEMTYCYDFFNGKSTEGKEISTDRIIKMEHFYNLVTIDGKEYKLDIAGALTAKVFNINHPEIKNISAHDFIFSKNLTLNPYSTLIKPNQSVLNLKTESQAE